MQYLAFDIEIVKEIPEGVTDWKGLRPLGISCAATLATGDERPVLWYHGQGAGEHLGGAMDLTEVRELVEYLSVKQRQGYTVLTWNGTGFDFDILAEESGLFNQCRDLALAHIDMMLQVFCIKGFPLGLDKAAKGLGLPGKTEGMHGDLAPVLWKQGAYGKVLEYVGQDVRTTLDVALAVEREHKVAWTSNSGRPNVCPIQGWLPVRDALALPEPDTSWMSDPWPRTKFTVWMGTQVAAEAQ